MRKAYAREHIEEMRASVAKAHEGIKKSPLAGRFETNLNAKTWKLVDPSGNRHTCTNLNLFVRSRPADFPNAASAAIMFRAQAMRELYIEIYSACGREFQTACAF